MCKTHKPQYRPPTPIPDRHPCRTTAWGEQLGRLVQAKRVQHGAVSHWDELTERERVQVIEAGLAVLDMVNFAVSATKNRTEEELFDLLRGDWTIDVLGAHVKRHEEYAGKA